MHTLQVRALALSLGIFTAFCIVFIALRAYWGRGGQQLVELISIYYKWFDTTPVGILLGAIYGFIDGMIWGAVIARLYNSFLPSVATSPQQ